MIQYYSCLPCVSCVAVLGHPTLPQNSLLGTQAFLDCALSFGSHEYGMHECRMSSVYIYIWESTVKLAGVELVWSLFRLTHIRAARKTREYICNSLARLVSPKSIWLDAEVQLASQSKHSYLVSCYKWRQLQLRKGTGYFLSSIGSLSYYTPRICT